MASLSEMLAAHNYMNPTAPDNGTSGFGEFSNIMIGKMKEQQAEKKRQENVKTQMTNAKQMMEAMSQMPDNSSSAKAIGTLEDDAQKRRKGVIKVSDYTPSIEQGVGEDGMPYFKASIKSATRQEQKAQFEMQKSQVEMEKSQAKSDLLNLYVKGDVQEGAILGEMATLGITADEFDLASQAKQRLRDIIERQTFSGQPTSIPSGFEATEMTRDRMGNMVPSGIKKVQQPTEMDALNTEAKRLDIARTRQDMEPVPMSETEKLQQEQMRLGMDKTKQDMAFNAEAQPFRFKRPLEEQKFAAEQNEKAQREQEKIDLAKANAESALSSINEIRKTMGHFGLMGGLPAIGGTDKVAWSKNIDRVKAMLTLGNLMELKAASKNGASGLGALSDGERKMLEDAASALDKGLPKEKAAEYLNDIERTLTRVLGGGESGGQAGQAQGGSVPSVGGSFNGEKVISVKRIR